MNQFIELGRGGSGGSGRARQPSGIRGVFSRVAAGARRIAGRVAGAFRR